MVGISRHDPEFGGIRNSLRWHCAPLRAAVVDFGRCAVLHRLYMALSAENLREPLMAVQQRLAELMRGA